MTVFFWIKGNLFELQNRYDHAKLGISITSFKVSKKLFLQLMVFWERWWKNRSKGDIIIVEYSIIACNSFFHFIERKNSSAWNGKIHSLDFPSILSNALSACMYIYLSFTSQALSNVEKFSVPMLFECVCSFNVISNSLSCKKHHIVFKLKSQNNLNGNISWNANVLMWISNCFSILGFKWFLSPQRWWYFVNFAYF